MTRRMTYQERISDPRWSKAGELFGACVELKLNVPRISPHAVPNIRFFVQQAALGEDSDYDDPDAALAGEVEKFVKLNGPGLALLEECRQIVKSSRGERAAAAPSRGARVLLCITHPVPPHFPHGAQV